MPSDVLRTGVSLPTKAQGGSPTLMGVDRDEYIALCQLAQLHPTQYDELHAALSAPLGADGGGSATSDRDAK